LGTEAFQRLTVFGIFASEEYWQTTNAALIGAALAIA